MIRLSLSQKSDQFRAELVQWLATQQIPEYRNTSLDEFVRVGRAWQQQLSTGRFLAVHWPSESGGRGLTLAEEAIVQEELVRANAPQVLGLFGLTMVGPILIRYGTARQKERFLRLILDGSEIWCQGFSEPGAGSDLVAIRTKAVPVDGGFRVTGQKVWTSFAHIADWCFVLCRTSEEGEKHKGLSYLLINMKSRGITTRPLVQISGDAEFNEVFFDDVFVPNENVVGDVGKGWQIAISTLMYERVVLTFARQLQSEVALREMLSQKLSQDTLHIESELAFQVAQSCAVRALSYKHLLHYATGAMPGVEGSIDKLIWSESFQQIAKLRLKMLGADLIFGEKERQSGKHVHNYLYSRGRTIAAGSSEIQRNIIAERILGLPRLKVMDVS